MHFFLDILWLVSTKSLEIYIWLHLVVMFAQCKLDTKQEKCLTVIAYLLFFIQIHSEKRFIEIPSTKKEDL